MITPLRGRGTWFEGLSVRQEANGETVPCGWLDQAALHGLLMRIRDLGLKLVALNIGQLSNPKTTHMPDAPAENLTYTGDE